MRIFYFAACFLAVLTITGQAAEYFCLVDFPKEEPAPGRGNIVFASTNPVERAELDVPGEAYVMTVQNWQWSAPGQREIPGAEQRQNFFPQLSGSNRFLVARVPETTAVQMTAAQTTTAQTTTLQATCGKETIKVEVSELGDTEKNRTAYHYFLWARCEYLRQCIQSGIPGGPVFAWQLRGAEDALFERIAETGIDEVNRSGRNAVVLDRSGGDLYNLFTASRTIQRNLGLQGGVREMNGDNHRTVDVDSIRGITVAEVDWKTLLAGKPEPKLDPLARCVPSDQHFLVFPSLAEAVRTAQMVEKSGLALFSKPLPDFGGSDTNLVSTVSTAFSRYWTQFGLTPADFMEPEIAATVRTLAVTGSDLYFNEGTDIAVLFETTDADALFARLNEKIEANTADKDVIQIEEHGFLVAADPDGLNTTGPDLAMTARTTTDRTISSYLLRLNDTTVLLTNSPYQLARLKDLEPVDSLAGIEEFRFFRDRYALDDPGETAFAILSDAAIRRWCSPRWRIGQARRLVMQDAIGQLQAEHLDEIVADNFGENRKEPKEIAKKAEEETHPARQLLDESPCWLSGDGVRSETYGRYVFLTPVAELDLAKVSEAEQRGYERWRDEFEGLWRQSFDPVGIRLSFRENVSEIDFTVIPLNVLAARDYEWFSEIVGESRFDPGTARFDAPLQFIVSLDMSRLPERYENLITTLLTGASTGWIGNYASLYFDRDPYWDKAVEVLNNPEKQHLMMVGMPLEDGSEFPFALEIGVKDPLLLTGFLAAARAYIEQTSPGTLEWGMRKHREHPYVCITGSEKEIGAPVRLYYTTTGGKWTFTSNENVIRRAIDRGLEEPLDKQWDKRDGKTDARPEKGDPGWLGSNLGFRFDGGTIDKAEALLAAITPRQSPDRLRKSLEPICAYYRTTCPNQDPGEIQQRLWGERFLTQEEFDVSPFADIRDADFGITFELGGLRAKSRIRFDTSR